MLIKLAREVKELRKQVAELTHQPLGEPDVDVAIILDRSAEAGEQDSKGEPGIAVYYDYQI